MSARDFLLASQLFSYPPPDAAEHLGALLERGAEVPASLREQLEALVRAPEGLEALRSEYIDLFDRGREQNSPYETEYGRDRPLQKGGELADLAGFYRAFGLDPEGSHEMLDHVAVECEFYALLELKAELLEERGDGEGVEIVRDAQRKFLESHLGRFVGALGARPGVARSSFYSEASRWLGALVAQACQTRGAQPLEVAYVAAEPEVMNCGAIPARP